MSYIKKFINSNYRKAILVGFDIVCFALINAFFYFLCKYAYYSIPVDDAKGFFINALVMGLLIFVCRTIFKVYANLWRYSSTSAYFKLVLSDCIGCVLALGIMNFAYTTYEGIWHYVVVGALNALLALSSRFVYRLIYKKRNSSDKGQTVAIVGAGQLGVSLASELKINSKYRPEFFVDIDRTKIGNIISGLPVYSEAEAEQHIRDGEISTVIISITKISAEDANELFTKYSKMGCEVKIYETPIDENKKSVIREFRIEDLLFRQPLTINNQEAFDFYSDKTVLVTGGGGSIGSELCRQIAKCHPKKLIILDIYENNAYDIQQELIRTYGDKLDLSVEIASVRERKRLEMVFSYYHPDIVFHAAAHKHVPLMEHSGIEAIKNNVLGTYNTADMAEKYGVKKFILVSTDKAVNPTNIMGASKRLCEMVIQCRIDSNTSFAAVRFGNVLGSNGSVIPLFKRQIASGGPVTITDKRIIRYFMTIPEASQLVMQAGAMAKKGELFVLDMGKPVKIYDLAINMIKLSGFKPDVDIKIEEIGLRPGEKLYEELLMKTETLDKTDNNMIFIERDTPYTRQEVEDKLAVLKAAVEETDTCSSEIIKAAIAKVVPTFHEPEEINRKADKSEEMKMVK